MRRTRYNRKGKFKLLLENTNNLLNEYFDSILKTEYDEFLDNIDGYSAIIYKFKTNSKTSYDLEFINSQEPANLKISEYRFIDIIKREYLINNYLVDCWDIGFTLSNRIGKNDRYVDDETYKKETNKNEVIELMGRISYLCNIFLEKYKPNILIVGKDTDSRKLRIYLQIFKNIFKNNFEIFEGKSTGYYEGAYYFINKNILNKNMKRIKEIIKEEYEKQTSIPQQKINKLSEYLKSLGLDVRNYNLENPTNEAGNPIVNDGMNGIRVTYKDRNDKYQMKVWFTNLFDDPNNEIVKKVSEFAKEYINTDGYENKI
jgi:hypothetical protein